MTAQLYNPNNPAVLGLEWFPITVSGYAVDTDSAAISMQYLANNVTLEAVDRVYAYMGSQTPPASAIVECTVTNGGVGGAVPLPPFNTFDMGGGFFLNLPAVEYSSGVGWSALDSTSFGGVTTTGTGAIWLVPTFDVTRTNVSGTFADVDDLFHDVSYPYCDNSDGIQFGANARHVWRSNIAGSLRHLSGRRIDKVQMLYIGFDYIGQKMTPYLTIGGTIYNGNAWLGSNGFTGVANVAEWKYNPATGKPWTAADIELFGTVGGSTVGAVTTAHPTGSGVIWAMGLLVNFSDDNRLGVGYNAVAPVPVEAWAQYSTPTPTYRNMLYADESSFETATGGWVNVSNTTLARSLTVAFSGVASLRLTAIAGANMVISSNGTAGSAQQRCPVTEGRFYYASAEVRAQTTGRTCTLAIQWYDITDSLISTDSGVGATDSNAAWTLIDVPLVQAPGGAAYASIRLTVTSPGAGEQHYIDGVMFNANSAESTFIVGGSAATFWNKQLGDDLVITFRRLPAGAPGGPSFNILDSGSPVPTTSAAAVTAYNPTVSANGFISDTGLGITGIFGLLLRKTSNQYSTDSYVYARHNIRSIYSATSVQQLITSTAVGSYGFVKAAISLVSDSTTAPLIVRVKRASDDFQLGTDVLIDPLDLVAPRTNLQNVSIPLGQVLALDNDQYYIEFATNAADSSVGWFIYSLDSVNGAKNSVTFGGSVDTLEIDLFAQTNEDVMAFLATIPAAPTNFQVTTLP